MFAPRACAACRALLAVLIGSACAGGFFGKRYEYEEDLTLDLDGSATLVVNASIPALVALRGLDLDPDRQPRRPRPDTRGLSISGDRGHARQPTLAPQRPALRADPGRDGDIRRLSEAAPFAWSNYQFVAEGGAHIFKQMVGTFGAEAGEPDELRMDGIGARRLPPAPAEPHTRAQLPRPRHGRDQLGATRQHPRLGTAPGRPSRGQAGSDRGAHGAASRSSIARCGSSRAPSAPPFYSSLVSSGGR